MLYDRDYMRHGDGRSLRSPIVLLLIALVFLFLVECFLRVWVGRSLGEWFGLSYQAVRRHEYWRLVTYQFLHDAPWPWHILFNGIALWFFGRSLLESQGTARFWQIYLIAGLAGGLLEIACQAWHPRYGASWTVGASANVMGLAAAFCFLFPTQEVVFFLYVIPVRLRAMTLFWVLFGYSLFGVIFPHGNIAHGAHLGGLLAGVAFVKFVIDEEARAWWRRMAPSRPPRRAAIAVAAGKAAGRGSRAGGEVEGQSPEDFMRREVDPILDKISAHGLQSLTERERRILEQARQRMKRD